MPLNDEDRETLVAYLDGELDEDAARAIEARLNTDPALRAEVEALKQAWDLLDYLPRPDPSPSFTHRTLQRLAVVEPVSTMTMPTRRTRARWPAALAWAAAVLLAGAAGVGIGGLVWPGTAGPRLDAEVEELLLRDLRAVEHKRLYENVDDLQFLRELGQTDLFGEGT